MGFFNEIRKVLFGAKAVSKSAAEKAFEAGKDATASALEKSGEVIEKAKDKVEDIGADVMETAENLWEKAVDAVEDVGEKVMDKAGDVIESVQEKVEDVGEKVMDKTSKVIDEIKEKGSEGMEKAGHLFEDVKEKASDVGSKLRDKGSDIVENVKSRGGDVADTTKENISSADEFIKDEHEDLFGADEDLASDEVRTTDYKDQLEDTVSGMGSAILDAKSDIAEKAKDVAEDLGNKLDETIQKAEALAAKEAAQPEYKAPSELLDKNLLDDKDDFFKKAEAFADGRYEEVTDPFSDPKPKIIKNEETASVKQSEVNSEPLPGFEDLDGDGNEIVDDALIVSGQEEE